MLVELLKSKIHRATVTDADLNYEGSITIDRALMDAVGILLHEKVSIYNISNGNRFDTYVIEGPANQGDICLNGAAARLVHKGDLVIICAYCSMESEKAPLWEPKVVLVNERNQVSKTVK